jgi:hypothetical protein
MEFISSDLPPQDFFQPTTDIPRDVLIAGIVSDFETGCVKAIPTLERLRDHAFLASPESLAQILIAGLKSLQEAR